MSDLTADFVVLVVVVSVLQMEGAHHLLFTVAIICLPVDKVDLLEQLALVVLELSYHFVKGVVKKW